MTLVCVRLRKCPVGAKKSTGDFGLCDGPEGSSRTEKECGFRRLARFDCIRILGLKLGGELHFCLCYVSVLLSAFKSYLLFK